MTFLQMLLIIREGAYGILTRGSICASLLAWTRTVVPPTLKMLALPRQAGQENRSAILGPRAEQLKWHPKGAGQRWPGWPGFGAAACVGDGASHPPAAIQGPVHRLR